MGFFTLKSSHTLFLIIFGLMLGAFGTYSYYPDYFQYSAYGAVFGILFLVFGLYLNAIIQGPRYPHIEHTIWDEYGIPFTQDFYINRSEATDKILDIFALMEIDPKTLSEIPIYAGGRFWYPYLVVTRWDVHVRDFGHVSTHIFVFPHPWDKFLKFERREDGAYLMGEVYSHGASAHLESYLSPYKHDYVGTEIPVYLGITAHLTYKKVTKSWSRVMAAIAQLDVDAYINKNRLNLFPFKTLDKIALEELEKKKPQLKPVIERWRKQNK